jgi:hypothetical protein
LYSETKFNAILYEESDRFNKIYKIYCVSITIVFVSKPNALNTSQCTFYNGLEEVLKTRGLQISSLGSKQYSNKAPLLAVHELMNDCEGAVIIGFKQIEILQCIEKEGTDKENRTRKGFFLPTAWNHLESGIAFALDLPLLIIREKGVEGGIFDAGVTDKFIHQIDLSVEDNEYFKSEIFLQPFNEWHEEVIVFRWKKTRMKMQQREYI